MAIDSTYILSLVLQEMQATGHDRHSGNSPVIALGFKITGRELPVVITMRRINPKLLSILRKNATSIGIYRKTNPYDTRYGMVIAPLLFLDDFDVIIATAVNERSEDPLGRLGTSASQMRKLIQQGATLLVDERGDECLGLPMFAPEKLIENMSESPWMKHIDDMIALSHALISFGSMFYDIRADEVSHYDDRGYIAAQIGAYIFEKASVDSLSHEELNFISNCIDYNNRFARQEVRSYCAHRALKRREYSDDSPVASLTTKVDNAIQILIPEQYEADENGNQSRKPRPQILISGESVCSLDELVREKMKADAADILANLRNIGFDSTLSAINQGVPIEDILA